MEDYDKHRDFLTRMLELKGSDVPKGDAGFFEKAAHKTVSGEDFADKIKRLTKGGSKSAGKFAKKGLKAFPVVGGLLAGLASQDANAAVPLLGEAEALGSPRGSMEDRFEQGDLTPEERMKFLKRFEGQ
jgi:hypothetical protein